MGQIVIVAYQPKPGRTNELKELVNMHVPRLKQEGLVTERMPVILQSCNGTIIEVFEWRSAEAIQQAHQNPAVHTMWGEFAAVCDYVPLNTLNETANIFAEFTALS
jgi:quinol monooxygenase YgiN